MRLIKSILVLVAFSLFFFFFLVGGFAALGIWLSRIGFSVLVSFDVAITLAYIVGMTTAYLMNRYFVFERSGRSLSNEYSRFVLVNIVALAQVWLVSIVMVRLVLPTIGWTFFPEATAHAIGVASPILTSYLGHRYFTYSKKASQDD